MSVGAEKIVTPVMVFVIVRVLLQLVDVKYPVDKVIAPPLHEAVRVPLFMYDARLALAVSLMNKNML